MKSITLTNFIDRILTRVCYCGHTKADHIKLQDWLKRKVQTGEVTTQCIAMRYEVQPNGHLYGSCCQCFGYHRKPTFIESYLYIQYCGFCHTLDVIIPSSRH